ncbi:MAG: nucleoside deaminase [Candidatus Aenigmatarchaeota archaeon]
MMFNEKFMRLAIKEGKKGDFPFGAIIVKNNRILSAAHNTAKSDSTAHAEINAIRKACKKLGNTNLSGCTLYSTCEPCPMCFTAAWWSRISKIVYGAEGKDVPEDEWKIDVSCAYLNRKSGSKINIKGGFLRDECKKLFE